MNRNDVDVRQRDAPKFSNDALICRHVGLLGGISEVIVDDKAGIIHFRNCHIPRGLFEWTAQTWFSCTLREVKAVHRYSVKGGRGIAIVTVAGRARILSDADNFEALCESMSRFVPQGFDPLHAESGLFQVIALALAFGGIFLVFITTPNGVSDNTRVVLSIVFGCSVFAVLIAGVKLLNR